MRLSPVLPLLVFISVMTLTITTTATTTTNPLTDPCYNYNMLNDSWRSTNNHQYTGCDQSVSWNGWYRLFIQGQSAQMPETCVDMNSCGAVVPLWLNGPHPRVEDGEVSRAVCGSWLSNCCFFRSNPIKVKACPGNYYVYEFVSPVSCSLAYCAEVIINKPTVTPNTTVAAIEQTTTATLTTSASTISTTSASTSPSTTSPLTSLSTSPSTTSPSTTLRDNVIGLRVRLSSFSDLTQSGNIEIFLQQIKQELVKKGLPSNIELKLRKLQKINS